MKLWKSVVLCCILIAVAVLLFQFNSKRNVAAKQITIQGIEISPAYHSKDDLSLNVKFLLDKPSRHGKKLLPLAHTISDIIIISDQDVLPSHLAGSDISLFFTHQSISRKMRFRSMVKESEDMPVKELFQKINQQAFFNASDHINLCFKEKFAEPANSFTIIVKLSDGTTFTEQSDAVVLAEAQ